MATEYLLSINKFDRPRKLVDVEGQAAATQMLITRLILLEPGTIQSHPDMGVGLKSKYHFGNMEDIQVLEDDIKDQIQKYLPGLYDASVRVTQYNDKIIHINIISNDLVYTANFDTDVMRLSEL